VLRIGCDGAQDGMPQVWANFSGNANVYGDGQWCITKNGGIFDFEIIG
jgi:hypothetical protein